MIARSLLIALLVVGTAGCIFEPECDSYEACSEPVDSNNSTSNSQPNAVANGQPNLATNGQPNAVTNNSSNANNTTTTPISCSPTECPDADQYVLGGELNRPLGCDAFGDLDFFEVAEEGSVCAGKPRGYSVYVTSCDTTYIIEVSLETPNLCADSAIFDVQLPGWACGMQNTRCEQTASQIKRSFIVDRNDIFDFEELELSVDAQRGGFDYVVRVRSRR